ncbi:ATP-binding protein [Pseudofrankia sp. DC12]|uniref:ATP-binding protein n=1 Tax=Pseudofrankia sp. DC12 TaxID=683315 RepID=UPI0006979477|nr:ATP-binding protein [Pseudofrankia sp. DC12]
MLTAELAELVRTLRDSRTDLARVEAKRATRELPKSTRETLSAFANSPGGGVILLGLDESQGFASTGVTDPKKVRDSLADLARDQMAPPLAPLIEIMEFEGVQLVVAEVAELDRSAKPCYYRGAGMANGSYVRVGDGDYRLGPAEVHALVAARGQPVDDTVPVQSATPDDLMPEIVGPYLQRLRLQRPFAFRDLGDRELLLATRVLVPGDTGPVPSLAGLLCFGRFPQHFFPQVEVTFVEYPTVDGAEIATGMRFLENRAFDGPVPIQVRETLVQLARAIRRGTVIAPGGGASTVYEYPLEALREAVVNAVVHRDLGQYSLGTQVQVEVYPDRITVRNPGGLFGAVRVSSLGDPGLSSARNALLLKLLEDVEVPGEGRTVCENRASGIRTMVRAMSAAGLPAPRFADHISWFEVTLSGPPPRRADLAAAARGNATLTNAAAASISRTTVPAERDWFVLESIRSAGRPLSRREIESMTGLTSARVKAALTALIDQRLVTAIGATRSPTRRYETAAAQVD